MDGKSTSKRGMQLSVWVILIALGIAAPVCGTALQSHSVITPRKLDLPKSKIQGVGLNCHAVFLPTKDMKAIGIHWVRLDLPGTEYTADKIRPLVSYYHDFGQLWILPQTAPDPVAAAKLMVDLGITDIEVFNETLNEGMLASRYVDQFKAIQRAVGTKARLYGPALGTWPLQKSYLEQCVRDGLNPDAITFHGYLQKDPNELKTWVSEAKQYGVPVVISELGYPDYLGAMPYRVKMKNNSIGSLFVRTRDALKGTPWCWYDGPNPVGDHNAGIFDDTNHPGQFVPNQNYRDIQAAISGSE